MEKDALSLALSNALAAAGKQVHIEADADFAVVPEGMTLFDLAPYHESKRRFDGHLYTRSLADFAAYLAHHYTDDELPAPPIFIDQANMAATVFFDIGTIMAPGHCHDSATLKLVPTAAYLHLPDMLGRQLTQQVLVDWLEDWAHVLTAESREAPMSISAAIAAVRHMETKETRKVETVVQTTFSSKGVLDEIETNSAAVMPDVFRLLIQPYEGLETTEIALQVIPMHTPSGACFRLRWRGEEAQREEIAASFKTALERDLGDRWPLIIGTFKPGA